MTLLNSWRATDSRREAERRGFVICDGCVLPYLMVGSTAAHASAAGWQFDDFETFNPYIVAGSYASQVERYLSVFPGEQMLVIDQADLLVDRRDTLREVFRFPGADEDFWSPRFDDVHNPGHRKVRWRHAGHRLARGRLAGSVRRIVPEAPRKVVFAPAKRLTTRKIEPPQIDDQLRDRLREAYLPEVERLRALTGKKFSSWQL